MGFGTPGYASPEAESEGRVGAPADIFAFGRVVEFMATGKSPTGDLSKINDDEISQLLAQQEDAIQSHRQKLFLI